MHLNVIQFHRMLRRGTLDLIVDRRGKLIVLLLEGPFMSNQVPLGQG